MNRQLNAILKTQAGFHTQQCTEPELIPSIFANLKDVPELVSNAHPIDRFFRQKYIELFQKLEGGSITVIDPLGKVIVGDPSAKLNCTITMFDLSSYTHVALRGSNGSAQAYIDGLWTVDNLSHLIRLFVSNRVILQRMESGLAKIAQTVFRALHALNRNTRTGSKKNIAAHYDLGNEFFKLFLDNRMMYSSALYEKGDSLNQASDRKLKRICDVLELNANDHLVEIGSGWGGFACFAAANTGCRVTTVTISQEQYDEARKRVQDEGLERQVIVKLQDYRDIEGRFDKLVSIEMIEAIGHQYLDTYFNKGNRH